MSGEKACRASYTPADFLKSIRGRPVVIRLNSGVHYRGFACVLACLDEYMNIAMEENRRVRKWPAKEQIWRRFYPWKQR
ncbi:hypothetical protein Bca4012_018244 [Brassica carinata]